MKTQMVSHTTVTMSGLLYIKHTQDITNVTFVRVLSTYILPFLDNNLRIILSGPLSS